MTLPTTESQTIIKPALHITDKEFKYQGPKLGGVSDSGVFGGRYSDGTDNALIKQDHKVHKNIAEYLASKMHRATHPEHQAEVEFVAIGEKGKSNPYIASIFFKDYQGDLFKVAYQEQGLVAPENRPRMMGTKNMINKLTNREVFAAPRLIDDVLSNSPGFAQSVVPRLLTNDMDMHSANLGVVRGSDGKNSIVSLDFGGANAALEDEIHPHSRIRHLPFIGPTNHFKEFQRKHKITPEFVRECDKVAKYDYSTTIDKAFAEIALFNPEPAIRDFGTSLGVPREIMRKTLKSRDKDQLVADIKAYYKEKIVARQEDMGKFSAQVKIDLCIKNFQSDQKEMSYQLDGKDISFKDVVEEHKQYFQDIVDGKEALKFRDKNNSDPRLKKRVIATMDAILKGEYQEKGLVELPEQSSYLSSLGNFLSGYMQRLLSVFHKTPLDTKQTSTAIVLASSSEQGSHHTSCAPHYQLPSHASDVLINRSATQSIDK